MGEIEKYNPEKHCCEYWYKDFCDCYKASVKEARDRNVDGTIDVLIDNNIEFALTATENIVFVINGRKKAYLSLKRDRGLFKCKFEGAAKWYTFGKTKFLDIFSETKCIA
jgi:hypothetical protein